MTERVTIADAAKCLGVSEQYVRQLCQEGYIKARKRKPGARNSPWVIYLKNLREYDADAVALYFGKKR